jgi:hypothetical protein
MKSEFPFVMVHVVCPYMSQRKRVATDQSVNGEIQRDKPPYEPRVKSIALHSCSGLMQITDLVLKLLCIWFAFSLVEHVLCCSTRRDQLHLFHAEIY